MGNYFSHDSNARSDSKIIALRMKHQWAGYGLYWALIEKLRDTTCYKLESDFSSLAYDLRADASMLKSVICDFGLFAFTEDGDYFYSESLLRRMEAKDAKSEKARESVNKRWNKARSQCDGNTNVSDSDTNVILLKEKKGKEIKEKISTIVDTKASACADVDPIPSSSEKPVKTWREDFNVYKADLKTAYESLVNDQVFIAERQKYDLRLDIRLSLEKAYKDYWNTETGWKKKKAARSKDLDWKKTFVNALSLNSNKVYLPSGNKCQYQPVTESQIKFTSYLQEHAPMMLNMPLQPVDDEIEELRKIPNDILLSVVEEINNNRYLTNGRNSVFLTIQEVLNKR